jgi:tetratricopeptide (TPR) repeat protein
MNPRKFWLVALLGVFLLPGVVVSADPVNQAMQQGKACIDKREYDGAIAAFTQAIGLDAKDAVAYCSRGDAYSQSVIDEQRKQSDLSDACRLARHRAASLCRDREKYCRAIADYAQAIRLNPKYVEAYSGRARAYEGMAEYDRAIADFSMAIRLNPSDSHLHLDRGSCYFGIGRYDNSIADCTEAIRLDPDQALAYVIRGASYAQKGDKAKADADSARAEKIMNQPSLFRFIQGLQSMGKRVSAPKSQEQSHPLGAIPPLTPPPSPPAESAPSRHPAH